MTRVDWSPLAAGSAPLTGSFRRIGWRVVRLPLDYRAVVLVLAACAGATWVAKWALGPDPTAQDVDRLGYGLPAVLDGRPWTLLTGMVLTKALTVPVPLFSLIGVALYERVAGHWRPLVVLVAGQVLGVLLACALLYPLRNTDVDRVRDLADATDFGLSVGGFATLGAFTAYLPAPWRRRVRVGLSCYFPAPLVLSGLIYDLTHPIGWFLGIGFGLWLLDPARQHGPDAAAFRRDELPGLAVAALVGGLAGIYFGRL